MRLTTFTFLTVLALLYAGLTLAETAMYQTWDHALRQQKQLEYDVAYFQNLRGFIEQLLHRLAIDSQHDPALAEMLKEHRIKVIITPEAQRVLQDSGPPAPATNSPGPSPAPTDATVPSETNKLPPTPPTPQPPDSSHP